jgi:hypothetical protein
VKAELRRLIALASVVSALASLLFAGQSYFFCPWMQKAAKGCCCAPERPSGDAPAISRAACCDRTTLAAAPSAPVDSSGASHVPAANGFSGELILMLDHPAPNARALASSVRERGARAGPERELFELHSAYLI